MSFLNPVNETVFVFSSTDAGAPQINYAARVAGDVKAVLKACLVTGYGTKDSAGWSIFSEVNHTIEFVSPSVAMSDYRIVINDAGTVSTTWQYRYKGSLASPLNNKPFKQLDYIDGANSLNGWRLIVTARGMYFIDAVYHTYANDVVARMVWIGQLKSALTNQSLINISFFCAGIGSQMTQPVDLMNISDSSDFSKTYKLGTFNVLNFNTANHLVFSIAPIVYTGVGVDVVSDVYLSNNGNIVAQQSGLLFRNTASRDDALGVYNGMLDNRPVVYASLVYNSISDDGVMYDYAKKMLVRLDYWEY